MRSRFFTRSERLILLFFFVYKQNFVLKDCSEFATHLIDLVELAYETIGKR